MGGKESLAVGSADAIAAGHLVGYCLATTGGAFLNGAPRWMQPIDMMCDFAAKAVPLAEPAPRRLIRDMALDGTLAVRLTMVSA